MRPYWILLRLEAYKLASTVFMVSHSQLLMPFTVPAAAIPSKDVKTSVTLANWLVEFFNDAIVPHPLQFKQTFVNQNKKH